MNKKLISLFLGVVTTVSLAGCSVESIDTNGLEKTESLEVIKSEVVKTRSTYILPTGKTSTVASGLEAPWSIAFLPDGTALVSQRDRGVVTHVSTSGAKYNVSYVASKPPCTKFCEGGTLGLAVMRDAAPKDVNEANANPYVGWSMFTYFTTSTDNRLAKFALKRDANGKWSAGKEKIIFKGVQRSSKSTTHNGGRIEIGTDGKLWIGIGDAGNPRHSQSRETLAGSVLRLNPDGSIPSDNPYGTAVWAKGIRDTQGIAFDDFGNVWSSEFGEDAWDELNLMQRGKNYGWPVVEGFNNYLSKTKNTNKKFTPPYLVWSPVNAAPSGLSFHKGSLFMASLRGGRLWVIPVLGDKKLGKPVDFFKGKFGRIRDAVPAPDGSIWIITSNFDGRGGFSSGGSTGSSDKIIRVEVKEVNFPK
jgi:glucose/arabinose dehydrogenase